MTTYEMKWMPSEGEKMDRYINYYRDSQSPSMGTQMSVEAFFNEFINIKIIINK